MFRKTEESKGTRAAQQEPTLKALAKRTCSGTGQRPGFVGTQTCFPRAENSTSLGARALQQRPTRPSVASVAHQSVVAADSRNAITKRDVSRSEQADDGRSSVIAFLQEVGLVHYAETLIRNGFDDMDTLLDIEEPDMKELGMTAHHVAVLRSRLQELRRHYGRDFDPHNPVVRFLKEAGLEQYVEALLSNGFDDMETLIEIEDADLRDFGVPRGHAVKLRKRLREYQLQCHAPLPTILQSRLDHRPSASSSPQALTRKAYQPTTATIVRGSNVTDKMKGAVESSWEQVQALGSYHVGELLYKHTFELAPEAVDLFPIEVRHKYRDWGADEGTDEGDVYESPALRKLFGKVVNAVGCAVAGLSDLGRLVPMLTQLGARHINYGVSEAHFPILGKALTITLRECLGDAFTPEVEHAWATVYGFITAIMIEGLRGAQKERMRKLANGSEYSRDDDNASQISDMRDGSARIGKVSEEEPESERVDILTPEAPQCGSWLHAGST